MLYPCVCPGVCECVCVSVSVNKGTHMFKARECACMSQRERGWSGVRHSGHTIPLLTSVINSGCLGVSAAVRVRGGRQACECCWRGIGCRELGGCWEVGSQMVGGGDNTAVLNETSRPPVGNPKFQHPGVHLSFPLKPLFSLLLFPFRVQQSLLKANGTNLK